MSSVAFFIGAAVNFLIFFSIRNEEDHKLMAASCYTAAIVLVCIGVDAL